MAFPEYFDLTEDPGWCYAYLEQFVGPGLPGHMGINYGFPLADKPPVPPVARCRDYLVTACGYGSVDRRDFPDICFRISAAIRFSTTGIVSLGPLAELI